MVSFTTSKSDAELIAKITERTLRIAAKEGIDYTYADAEMDLTACHANGNPLKLRELLAADDLNFIHDVFGIRRHLDRQTGQLNNCFSPRFAR